MTARGVHAILFAAALPLAGCAGGMAVAPPPTETTLAGTPLGELPTQPMVSGQCALVLWSRAALPLRFLMTLDTPPVARIALDGRVVELPRVFQSGEPVFGQFPLQRFEGEEVSLSVSFSTEVSGALEGGAVVSSAAVEYSGASGWTAIIPAAGLIACQE